MPVVYSTLTASNKYTEYRPLTKERPHNIVLKSVLIKGGSNVADKVLHTPLGVATHVTDEELAFLKENPSFKHHLEKGFVRFSDHKTDPEKVAADMETRDASAPLTPGDFQNKGGAKPSDVNEAAPKKSVFQALKDKATGE